MKAITGIALTALLMGMLMLAFNIQQTESPEPPATEWTRTYRREDNESAVAVVETSDGGYAIAGDTNSFGMGGTDFWLVKVAGRPTHGDKLGLLALGIGLAAATLVVAVSTTIYAFIKRARTPKNSTISL